MTIRKIHFWKFINLIAKIIFLLTCYGTMTFLIGMGKLLGSRLPVEQLQNDPHLLATAVNVAHLRLDQVCWSIHLIIGAIISWSFMSWTKKKLKQINTCFK